MKGTKPVHGHVTMYKLFSEEKSLLRINDTVYAVSKIEGHSPEVARKAWRLRKLSDTREVYEVIYDVHDGTWGLECTCADWVFRRHNKDPRGCKHIIACQVTGLLPAAPTDQQDDGPEPELPF